MHTFTDNAGRVWTANLNVATLKRVRALAGVDLASAILVERDGRVEASLLERLASVPALLVDALYALCKENYPALYKKVKKAIADGRWEVQGGMWVEADCNVPSGESLVRQCLVGQRFFKEEFGVVPRNLWLPDVFG